jgi:hypothetical protein
VSATPRFRGTFRRCIRSMFKNAIAVVQRLRIRPSLATKTSRFVLEFCAQSTAPTFTTRLIHEKQIATSTFALWANEEATITEASSRRDDLDSHRRFVNRSNSSTDVRLKQSVRLAQAPTIRVQIQRRTRHRRQPKRTVKKVDPCEQFHHALLSPLAQNPDRC